MTKTAKSPPMTASLEKWLAEPFDPKRLLPWEKQVKAGALEGRAIGLRPKALTFEAETDGPTIRARFLEALLLGELGDVHHRGVQFWNQLPKVKPARVIGELNLRGAGAAGKPLPILQINQFVFDQRPNFDLAHLTFLSLSDCKFRNGVDLQRAHIRGGLFLRSIESRGEINLKAATIGGGLSLTGAKLMHKDAMALLADGATIGGGVFAKASGGARGLVAWGQVSFHSATVQGSFEWNGAVLLARTRGGRRSWRSISTCGDKLFSCVMVKTGRLLLWAA
ncbi:MAG: hypothetical protein AAGB18_04965 [Pseudomonadota bacterium]